MGLTNGSSNNSKIVTISNGKFTIRLPDDSEDPNAIQRELKAGPNAGKLVKELQYTGIEGKIQSCYVDESEYGANFVTELEDDEGSKFSLQISLDSKFFGQYAKRMPNIDKSKALFLGLGWDKEKESNFLFIRQEGESIKFAYTKENPNGLPAPIKKTVKGVEKWDWEEHENFLYEVAMDFTGTQSGKDKIVEKFNAVEREEIPF